ncbi:hypothetical protein [Candidatus Poriferisodalis sp.]|uniref:hypothetical protein n=1 Tax=Candidatus Poriferisodalis sp. TaxID=3101277 RepID=UPI003C6F9035
MDDSVSAGSAIQTKGKRAASLYEQVFNSEQARDAYLNTTQAILTGDPALPEIEEIRQKLKNSSIAWIFTPNCRLPRPIFRSRNSTLVGKTDILEAIKRLENS